MYLSPSHFDCAVSVQARGSLPCVAVTALHTGPITSGGRKFSLPIGRASSVNELPTTRADVEPSRDETQVVTTPNPGSATRCDAMPQTLHRPRNVPRASPTKYNRGKSRCLTIGASAIKRGDYGLQGKRDRGMNRVRLCLRTRPARRPPLPPRKPWAHRLSTSIRWSWNSAGG